MPAPHDPAMVRRFTSRGTARKWRNRDDHVERFNGRISEIVKQIRFASAAELEATLNNDVLTYNDHIPQRPLGDICPVYSLKAWQDKKPGFFVKRVYKQAKLDK